MNRFPFKGKIIVPVYGVEERKAGVTADRRNMEFHLYPADTIKILWLYLPFCSLAVTFQEIAAPAHFDDLPERVGQ